MAGIGTYQDASRREDLLDIMGDVSPDETPLMTLLGTSNAAGTLHEWTKFQLDRPTTTQADVEGSDTTFPDLTAPSREYNYTNIVKKGIFVSRTEKKANVAAVGDPWAFQKAQGLRRTKLQMEFNLINSTPGASGASGVARKMRGIDNFITTLATARNSGTSFSEQELNDMDKDAWNTVDPDKVWDMLLCPFEIKQVIAGYNGNSTRFIDATSRRLVKEVQIYESAGGTKRIFAHKDVRRSAGTLTVYGIREDLFKVAYYDKPIFEELAKTGDGDKGHWVTEFTLESLEERASTKRTGYVNP